MLRFLVIGAGQCGNRILDTLMREGYGKGRLSRLIATRERSGAIQPMAVNTSKNDLMELEYIRDKEQLHMPGTHGAGANRIIGKETFKNNRDMLLEKIGQLGDFDACIVLTSAGGGTGSSFTPFIVDLVKSMYGIPVLPFVVLPFREESDIFLQNAGFSLKDLKTTEADSIVLASNDWLRKTQGNQSLYKAYDQINNTVAHRLLFMLDAMSSEMMITADLGDLMTTVGTGSGFATMGYARGTPHQPVKEVIAESFEEDGLLFHCDPLQEAARALLLIQGPEERLDVDSIMNAVTHFSEDIGDVFKGVRVAGEDLEVLSLFSLRKSEELERVVTEAKQILEKRQKRKASEQPDAKLKKEMEDVDDYSLEY